MLDIKIDISIVNILIGKDIKPDLSNGVEFIAEDIKQYMQK